MNELNTLWNNRIYYLIVDWKFYIEILNLTIDRKTKTWRNINIILIGVSILSIGGWFQFESLKFIWFLLLGVVQIIRIFRNQIFISEELIRDMQKSLEFYLSNINELENLYYDFYLSKIQIRSVKIKFGKLKEREINIIKLQKFSTITSNKNDIETAERQTDLFLQRLIKNLQNE